MSAVLSPFGTLATLPRELRDEIYSLVVAEDGREHVFQSEREWRGQGQGPKKWTGDLAILESSRSIRQEALAVLYAQGHFRFYEGCTSPMFQHERSDIPFVDHLSHITIAFYVLIHDDDWLSERHIAPEEHDNRLLEMTAAPNSFFIGADEMRHSCIIRLAYCSPILTLLLESPLFHAIGRLIGFNSVTLILDSDDDMWGEHDPYSDGRIPTFPDFATLVARVSSALELDLGASSTRVIEKRDPDWDTHLQCEVTFHPQDHLAKQRVLKDSNNRRGGAALSDHSQG